VNESPGIVYTGIMNDKGVRYTLVRHRNERHEQKRACKFDRDIFVAMVEQSPDSVCPPERNERFKLDSLPIRLSYRISAPRIEREGSRSISSPSSRTSFSRFAISTVYVYFVILCETQSEKKCRFIRGMLPYTSPSLSPQLLTRKGLQLGNSKNYETLVMRREHPDM
jgi:hypothetical protein